MVYIYIYKLNWAWTHLVWMVRRPLGILVNHHGYNIPVCSYNGENCKKHFEILKHFKITKIIHHLQSKHSVTMIIVCHLEHI
jgi:hypothetical protein